MTKKLWGGRFQKEVDKDFFEFQKSISHDYKLATFDIYHSLIHVEALKDAEILDSKEAKKLISKLEEVKNEIEEEIKAGKFKPHESEDIHTEIQNRIENKIPGELPLKLHTLRSRNDQVVFDEKFYCAGKALDIVGVLLDLRDSLITIAERYKKQRFLGYTHTQRAQVISFVSYITAFNYMLKRDCERTNRFYEYLFIYIGAGALTGSSLTRQNYDEAISKLSSVKDWKKLKPLENGLDNVSDRDFIIEFLSIISIIQMHLSRLAEDMILYSTKEFNFIDLPEEFCTGSSLMPHKKNPDFLELVRGYTGKIYGNLISVLTTMKGLPLTYNRDMQLEKEPLFSSVELIENELKLMAKFIKKIHLNTEVIDGVLNDKKNITLYATELAERLVKEKKVPFKRAHNIVGRLTIMIEKARGDIEKLDYDTIKKELHPDLNKNFIAKTMNPSYAIKYKNTFSKKIPKITNRKK